MAEIKTKETCPQCEQASGVEIIYGRGDTISETLCIAAKDGDVALGGTYRKWDWEEELINIKCLQCKHEWHGSDMNLLHKHRVIHAGQVQSQS